MTKFKVGDLVEAFGCKGKVTHVSYFGNFTVEFPKYKFMYFEPNGKLEYWHKKPSLKLIKKKGKKK